MAGGGHHEPVRFDPAIDRWNNMRENVYKTFRFTPKATRQVVAWGLVFPAAIATVAWTYDNRFDWAGKQRGSSLLAKPPTVPAVKDEE